MEDTKQFLARDARAVAESTRATINHIYKAIKEEAKEGKTCLVNGWSLAGYSDTKQKAIIAELQEAGYTVNVEVKLMISW